MIRSTLTLLLVAFPALLLAGEGQIEIGPTTSFPIVIDAPGSYLLTANLEVTNPLENAIEIATSGVVLDLGGHTVKGPGEGASGRNGIILTSATATDVTLRNGIVTGFDYGVELTQFTTPTSSRIEAIQAFDNRMGIAAWGAVLERCTSRSNTDYGYFLYASVAEDCLAADNLIGFEAREGTILRGAVAVDNSLYGMRLGLASMASQCTVRGSGDWGIYLHEDESNNVVGCAGSGNTSGNIVNCGLSNGCYDNALP